MSQDKPEKLVAVSLYQNCVPTLPNDIRSAPEDMPQFTIGRKTSFF